MVSKSSSSSINVLQLKLLVLLITVASGRLFWGFVVAFPLDGVPKNSSSLTLPQIRNKNQQLHAALDIGQCVGGNVGQIEWKGIKLFEGFVLQ